MALNALFTGASGLAANSSALDVIGNNLANLNTTGFKTQRALFLDAVYQTLSSGTSAQGAGGGANPVQVGFGVSVGAVDSEFNQGTLNPTGRSLDLGIQGNGFFTVSDGSQTLYTRSGAFSVDDAGYLVDPSTGFRVQRFGTVGEPGSANGAGFQVPGNLDIRIPFGAGVPGLPTTSVVMQGNLNANAPVGTPSFAAINYYDSLSTPRSFNVTFTKTAINTYSVSVTTSGTETVTVPNVSVVFDSSGFLASPASIDVSLSGFTSAADQTITLDLGTPNTASGISQFGGSKTVAAVTQNGSGAGTLTDVSVDASGLVQGTFSNGRTVSLGQLALARFNNQAGLVREGNNYFQSSAASGNAIIGIANEGGIGTVQGGTLEGSNVDIATEFAKLIIAQRGFQVNSQVVSAANEVLQEVANVIR